MGPRGFRVLRHPALSADTLVRFRVCKSALRLHYARLAPYVTISDPPIHQTPTNISLAHPKDPSNQSGPSQGSSTYNTPSPAPSSPPLPTSDAESVETPSTGSDVSAEQRPLFESSVPTKYVHPSIDPQIHPLLPQTPPLPSSPPFNTHKFFGVLELSFSSSVARNLMHATRGLLVNRISRVRRDALTTQDLESQAYLFKAALSELRTETSMLTRNETATMRTATTALRREVDALDTRMKEDTATLKHEIQMDLDSRSNEAKGDLKRIDMQIEEVLSRALITIGELKTQVEESRWEKMKAAVGALAVLSLAIIVSMEIVVVQPKAEKRSAPPPSQPEIMPPTGLQPWVT